MIGNLIGAFVVILIGITLGPMIYKELINGGLNNTLVGLVTLFFALAIGATAIGTISSALKNAGLVEVAEWKEEYEEKDPNHKQTYKEYVQERLEIEQMMRIPWWRFW